MAIGSQRQVPSAPDRFLVLSMRLRDRRRSLGLTQQQVVRRLAAYGVTTTNKALSSLEHGAGIDAAKLPEFAAALDCTVTYLLGLTDDPANWQPENSLGPRTYRIDDRPGRRPSNDLASRAAQDVEGLDIAAASSGRVDATEAGADSRPTAATSWILGPYPAGSVSDAGGGSGDPADNAAP